MNEIMNILTILILILSWGFILFGMIAIYKLDNLYSRILSATTIDSVAALTMLLGLLIFKLTSIEYIIRFSLLILFLLITNPISSHVNIRSAYLTGYELDKLKRYDKKSGDHYD